MSGGEEFAAWTDPAAATASARAARVTLAAMREDELALGDVLAELVDAGPDAIMRVVLASAAQSASLAVSLAEATGEPDPTRELMKLVAAAVAQVSALGGPS